MLCFSKSTSLSSDCSSDRLANDKAEKSRGGCPCTVTSWGINILGSSKSSMRTVNRLYVVHQPHSAQLAVYREVTKHPQSPLEFQSRIRASHMGVYFVSSRPSTSLCKLTFYPTKLSNGTSPPAPIANGHDRMMQTKLWTERTQTQFVVHCVSRLLSLADKILHHISRKQGTIIH